MDALKQFTIPIKGLKPGVHPFEFKIDDAFFSHFEESPIKQGDIEVNLTIDKRPEMLVLDFGFEGKTPTSCDRCLADIQLPLSGNHQMVVKFSEETQEEEEIVYLPWDAPELNVASFIYENIVLSLPMIKVYDCDQDEAPPCDFKMLAFLQPAEEVEPEPEESDGNSIWSELKKNFNNDN